MTQAVSIAPGVSFVEDVQFPAYRRSTRAGQTKYPFDLVEKVGAGFEIDLKLSAVRVAVNRYNRRHKGRRKFAVRFVDGKSLVKRIL